MLLEVLGLLSSHGLPAGQQVSSAADSSGGGPGGCRAKRTEGLVAVGLVGVWVSELRAWQVHG